MKKKTALQWAEYHGACPEAIAWLKRQGTVTMSEAYRRCHRVDWMFWALFQSKVMRQPSGREIELDKALEFFEEECTAKMPDGNGDCVDVCGHPESGHPLTQRELAQWADRLREYVVPQSKVAPVRK